jgi:hypothetical protein
MAKKSKKSAYVTVGVVILLIVAGIFLFKKNATAPTVVETSQVQQTTPLVTKITITDQPITETNFTGTKSIITGSGPLADAARIYIDGTVATFKQSADEGVPAIRAQFGASEPASMYEIDIKATYVNASKTESIIIDDYEYTGGANGNNSYKVFTASNTTGKILALSDVISGSQQAAFTAYVKDQLSKWVPDGSDGPVVFADQVQALTFDSFTNWSFDKTNLIIYFDKYAVGPGSLGSIAFPLPLSKVKGYLTSSNF